MRIKNTEKFPFDLEFFGLQILLELLAICTLYKLVLNFMLGLGLKNCFKVIVYKKKLVIC